MGTFKNILISFSFLVVLFLQAQIGISQVNLVPNPSFEDTVVCPDAGGEVGNAANWYVVKNTPDYFNSCCIYPSFSVPSNVFGYHNAATGNAYCGLYTYLPPPYSREFFGVQLTAPLIINTLYYVSFKVSSCKSDLVASSAASNKTGILFSVNKYDLNNIPSLNNFAQVKTDSVITDTLNWTIIKGSFIADSAYQFITLGNFFTNANTDTIHYVFSPSGTYAAYYIIDDVCVSTDSNTCFAVTGLNSTLTKNELRVYPNPASNKLIIKRGDEKTFSVLVFNSMGVLIKTLSNLNWQDDLITMDIASYPNGIYFLIAVDANKNKKIKFVINN